MKALYTPPNSATAVRVTILGPTRDGLKMWVQLENGQAIRVPQSELQSEK